MSIESIMCKDIVSVRMDDTLRAVKDIFDHVSFHHLMVIDDGILYGVISDRDLLKSVSPYIGTVSETTKDLACLNKKAHQIMTRKPITLLAGASIYDAIEIFNHHRISCIPVVDQDNRPVGVLSWRDIFRAMAARHSSVTEEVES